LANLDQFVESIRGGQFDQIAQNRAGQLIAKGHAAKLLNMRSTLLTLAGGDAMPSAAISELLSMRTGQGYAEFGVSSFGADAESERPRHTGRQVGRVPAGQPRHHRLRRHVGVQLNIIAERLLGCCATRRPARTARPSREIHSRTGFWSGHGADA
jgi:hypothetical protein